MNSTICNVANDSSASSAAEVTLALIFALIGPLIGTLGSQAQKTTLKNNPGRNYLCLPLWYIGVVMMGLKGIFDGLCLASAPLAMCSGVSGGAGIIINVAMSYALQGEVLLQRGYAGCVLVILGIIAVGLASLGEADYCFSVDKVEDRLTQAPVLIFLFCEIIFFSLHVAMMPDGCYSPAIDVSLEERNVGDNTTDRGPDCMDHEMEGSGRSIVQPQHKQDNGESEAMGTVFDSLIRHCKQFFTDVSYVGITGILAAQGFLCWKVALELLQMTISEANNQMSTARFWLSIIGGAFFTTVDLHTYALAVRKDDIVVVFPIYNSYAIGFTMLQGIFLLGETEGMNFSSSVLLMIAPLSFAVGTMLTSHGSTQITVPSAHSNPVQGFPDRVPIP